MFCFEAELEEVAGQVEQSAGWMKENLDKLVSWAVSKAGSLILAIIFLVVGLKIVKLLVKLIQKSFEKHKMDPSVSGFLISLIHILLNILVFITAATVIGFEMTSFITVLGTASLAVGLALQGSLSNLAGGVLILMLKPFTVGDYIIEQGTGQEGTVTSIDIFYTRLKTTDNRMIVVPNGNLSATSIINVTANPTRRLDMTIGVAYDSDISMVKQALLEAVLSDDRVLKEEPVDIFIERFDSSAITMGMHFWVPGKDYWEVKWSTQRKVKEILDQYHIGIPYQQMDVHLDRKTLSGEMSDE